ncbi:NAD(P)/FAD-dependent oxidoreductase [Ideonella sp. A 288]|uniref:NAD(P)/FAD-dependent oxidoreductase n=1 Tax=Ideonella sp. A 288 TaxID=1962181 RepID=UPI000B4B3137|nr:FAD-dependent oxidoreductase [Ideonella sp. A 288]
MTARRRVAVVGSGIAGLGTAWQLRDDADVVLFEADRHFGGHAHTVDLTLEGITHGVDTGFLVFNHATYPRLRALFEAIGVKTTPSEMSFSVQAAGLEWSGTDLDSVFAQRRNLLRPSFLRMLTDLVRFNRLCTTLAETGADEAMREPIGDFLDTHRFSEGFRQNYLLPMLGCIWSCPTDQMLRFPVATMIRFCHNHGLIRVTQRPQWYTVTGGSRHYVQALVRDLPDARLNTPVRGLRRVPPGSASGGVWVQTDRGEERFDEVVLACHTDQSLALLGDGASAEERRLLGAIPYQANRAVLHTDASLLPRRRKAWAAWNYERSGDLAREQSAVCLHYLINRLQPLPWQTPVIVSLNPSREPAPSTVHGEFHYAHPVFDQRALDAQARLSSIQGRAHVWFAGAWTGYGFHEDGWSSAVDVVDVLRLRWREADGLAARDAA